MILHLCNLIPLKFFLFILITHFRRLLMMYKCENRFVHSLSCEYIKNTSKIGRYYSFQHLYAYSFLWQMNSSSGNSFFLHSKPELSGSPPRRAPPQIGVPETFNHSCRTERTSDLADREIGKSGIEIVNGDFGAIIEPRQLVKDVNMLSLGLPALRTGNSSLLLFFSVCE